MGWPPKGIPSRSFPRKKVGCWLVLVWCLRVEYWAAWLAWLMPNEKPIRMRWWGKAQDAGCTNWKCVQMHVWRKIGCWILWPKTLVYRFIWLSLSWYKL